MRCESKEAPLGVESAYPKLSWQIISDKRNTVQTAYRIMVADDSSLLLSNTGNQWDSQKVPSDQSISLEYKGNQLLPAKTYYWKVITWDNQRRSASSAITSWQMGLPASQDWKGAKWIAYEKLDDSLRIVPAVENRGSKTLLPLNNTLPLLRKSFFITKPI